jgi:uncharacterized protein (TIGR02757 family)
VIDLEIKSFLDEKVVQYNNPNFIESDPIYIPHQFSLKEDIEIAGFFSASIAWGSRPTIIRNAIRLMNMMGNAPFEYVMNCTEENLEALDGFVHRTFNASDAMFFVKALRNIYLNHDGLEGVFSYHRTETSIIPAIQALNQIFFAQMHPARTRKHIANPANGSAAKKINMYLRWMVRNDNKGVDFGLWKTIPPKVLSCPLDVHSGNAARKLGLIFRKQNDIKAVHELDEQLRIMDAEDPVKYDFALFGLGVFEKF